MNSKLGFSLVELVVVIALVAILSSIAIPVYRDYVAKARTAELISSMKGAILLPATLFYERNGYFANAQSMGFSGAISQILPTSFIGSNMEPYISSLRLQTDDVYCNQIVGIHAQFDSSPGPVFWLRIYTMNIDDVMTTVCIADTVEIEIDGCPFDWGAVNALRNAACP